MSLNNDFPSDWQTMYNIRDLGGFPTGSGGSTAYGRFLRADAPVRLNEHDLKLLLSYPVTRVIDLRSHDEIARADNPLAREPSIDYINISLLGTDLDKNMTRLEKTFAREKKKRPQLVDLYHFMLDYSQREIGQVLSYLAADTPGARLFHCSHGKDRTGLITALLLLLADVPETHIVEDYRISEQLLQPWFDSIMGKIPQSHHNYLSTPAVYMEKTLTYLKKHYGNVSKYLLTCGVSEALQEQLKELLVVRKKPAGLS